MENKRKTFSSLSKRQKNRRLKRRIECLSQREACSRFNTAAEIIDYSDEFTDYENDESSSSDEDETMIDRNCSDTSSCVEQNSINESTSQIQPSHEDNYFTNNCISDESMDEEITENSHENDVKICNCSSQLLSVLGSWAANEKCVPKSAISRLLSKLNEKFIDVPKTTDTLLKRTQETAPEVSFKPMCNGEYAHFNWLACLQELIEKTDSLENISKNTIRLSINIDGIPLFNNTNKCTCYPILISPLEFPHCILTVGIYCSNKVGLKQMPKPEELLQDFMNDLKKVNSEINTTVGKYKLSLGPFICDSPVRCDLKGIVSHNAYNSCERCQQEGAYIGGHVVLPEMSCPLRTDLNFEEQSDEGHHKNISMLQEMGYPMVTGFTLDILHLIYLGVLKRWLGRLKSSKRKSVKRHLDSRRIDIFDKSCKQVAKYLPSEFNRKLDGGLTHLCTWKGSEFRTFLLYAGIVVLREKDIVSSEMYDNFLLLSVSIRLLTLDDSANEIPFIRDIINKFIASSIQLFGLEFLSYNVHSFIHLPDDYLAYGNLDNISAFKFESYLGSEIKSPINSGYKPLQQISNHVKRRNFKIKTFEKKQNFFCTKPSYAVTEFCCGNSYKAVHFGNTLIRRGELDCRDNTIQLEDDSIAVVRDIIHSSEGVKLVVQKFKLKTPLFTSPIDSTIIGTYRVMDLMDITMIDSREVRTKMVRLPYKNYYVAIRMSNSNKLVK